MSEVLEKIEQLVKSDRVVLFMKGNRAAPQCGFSATVVEILDQYLPSYTTVNVLSDPQIRDGVKQYADWPTIPQLFVDGQFVGGCDIVREMDSTGELAKSLGDLVKPPAPPTITLTDEAAEVFREAAKDAGPGEALRLSIDGRFSHDLFIGPGRDGDVEIEANGVKLRLDRPSARRADGVSIAYIDGPQGGFKIDNPNAPPSVKAIAPAEAKAMLERDPGLHFIDVRTPGERERAQIPGTVLLDPPTMAMLSKLPKDTPLVFHCHHGQRSQQAALHFLELGFRTVYNVVGGIEAWSREVDPAIPRY